MFSHENMRNAKIVSGGKSGTSSGARAAAGDAMDKARELVSGAKDKAGPNWNFAGDVLNDYTHGMRAGLAGERARTIYKRAGIVTAGLAGAAGLYEGGKYAYHKHQEHKSIPSTGESY